MPKQSTQFGQITISNLPKTTAEQIRFLIEERRYTKTSMTIVAIDLLFREEYGRAVEEHNTVPDETLYAQVAKRITETTELQPYRGTILYDWPEGDEHLRWALNAPASEVIEWATAVEASEP